MDNPEGLLLELSEFEKRKPREISKELEDYLLHIAKTGDTVFPWSKLKPLFKYKLDLVITDFYESCPADDVPACQNVDQFKYELLREKIMECVDAFSSAPFTIQRLCELLVSPKKHYKQTDKFMRGIEKNILVVSTVEPGRLKHYDDPEPIMNGILENTVPDDGGTFDGPSHDGDQVTTTFPGKAANISGSDNSLGSVDSGISESSEGMEPETASNEMEDDTSAVTMEIEVACTDTNLQHSTAEKEENMTESVEREQNDVTEVKEMLQEDRENVEQRQETKEPQDSMKIDIDVVEDHESIMVDKLRPEDNAETFDVSSVGEISEAEQGGNVNENDVYKEESEEVEMNDVVENVNGSKGDKFDDSVDITAVARTVVANLGAGCGDSLSEKTGFEHTGDLKEHTELVSKNETEEQKVKETESTFEMIDKTVEMKSEFITEECGHTKNEEMKEIPRNAGDSRSITEISPLLEKEESGTKSRCETEVKSSDGIRSENELQVRVQGAPQVSSVGEEPQERVEDLSEVGNMEEESQEAVEGLSQVKNIEEEPQEGVHGLSEVENKGEETNENVQCLSQVGDLGEESQERIQDTSSVENTETEPQEKVQAPLQEGKMEEEFQERIQVPPPVADMGEGHKDRVQSPFQLENLEGEPQNKDQEGNMVEKTQSTCCVEKLEKKELITSEGDIVDDNFEASFTEESLGGKVQAFLPEDSLCESVQISPLGESSVDGEQAASSEEELGERVQSSEGENLREQTEISSQHESSDDGVQESTINEKTGKLEQSSSSSVCLEKTESSVCVTSKEESEHSESLNSNEHTASAGKDNVTKEKTEENEEPMEQD